MSDDQRCWYCVRSKLKHERVAESWLREELGVECFLPQISRSLRGRRAGEKVFEPMFPGYLFAKFDIGLEFRKVQFAQGVAGVVRMGDRFPFLSEKVVEDVRAFCREFETTQGLRHAIEIGDRVELVGKMFEGSTGEVLELVPAKNRIRVLVDFLNQSIAVELDSHQVLKSEI